MAETIQEPGKHDSQWRSSTIPPRRSSVASAMGFTTGDFRILIDSEIMKVTGVSGTTLTVARHQEGTSAASHTNGTAVYHVLDGRGTRRPRSK